VFFDPSRENERRKLRGIGQVKRRAATASPATVVHYTKCDLQPPGTPVTFFRKTKEICIFSDFFVVYSFVTFSLTAMKEIYFLFSICNIFFSQRFCDFYLKCLWRKKRVVFCFSAIFFQMLSFFFLIDL